MAYHGHVVIDTDSHMREYWDLDRTYREHIDPEYRAQYERFSAGVKERQKRPGETGLTEVWTNPVLRPLGVRDVFDAPARELVPGESVADRTLGVVASGKGIDPAVNWDPALRLRDMDTADIDISVMFASQSDGFAALRNPGFESALYRAYNRYMSNFCAGSGGRLVWLANATMRDIPETMEQLRFWTEQDANFGGLFMPRAFPDGRLLDNPDLHPLYQLSQDLDMPLWVHGDPMHPPYTPGAQALDYAAFSRPVLKGWGGMTALGALIGGGVFDLFPRLRVGLFENGAGWMPWFIEKLDESFHPGARTTPYMQRRPSEIVAGGQLLCAIDVGRTRARPLRRGARRGRVGLLDRLPAHADALARRRLGRHRRRRPVGERQDQDTRRERPPLPAAPRRRRVRRVTPS